jgi:hypothetical protein
MMVHDDYVSKREEFINISRVLFISIITKQTKKHQALFLVYPVCGLKSQT